MHVSVMRCLSSRWVTLLVWCGLSLSGFCGIPTNHGYMKNCDPKGNNFTFYWTPEYIVISQEMTVYVNFTAPVDWSGGEAHCVGTVPTCPVPVFEKTMSLTCNDVDQMLPGHCPVKKGDSVTWMNGTAKYVIRASWPIPEDNYTFVCEVWNQKKELFLCAKGPVKVKDPPEPFMMRATGNQARADHDRLGRGGNDAQGTLNMVENMERTNIQAEEMNIVDWRNPLSDEEPNFETSDTE